MRPVTIEKEGRTAIITINNPPLNVIDNAVRSGLRECLRIVKEDDSITTVILTGFGEKAFMAGADIKDFPDMIGKTDAALNFVRQANEVWHMLETLDKPTIAAINGLALGAGCEMALCCDILIAEEGCKIGLPEIKLGLIPGGGGTQRLPRKVGRQVAMELIFTGEPISSEEALRIGLLNHIAGKGKAVTKAKETAALINRHSLVALRAAKMAVNAPSAMTLDGIVHEEVLFQTLFMSVDAKEGIDAFMGKRKAEFKHQ